MKAIISMLILATPALSFADQTINDACMSRVLTSAFTTEASHALLNVGTSIKLSDSKQPVADKKGLHFTISFEVTEPNDNNGPAFHAVEVVATNTASDNCPIVLSKFLAD